MGSTSAPTTYTPTSPWSPPDKYNRQSCHGTVRIGDVVYEDVSIERAVPLPHGSAPVETRYSGTRLSAVPRVCTARGGEDLS